MKHGNKIYKAHFLTSYSYILQYTCMYTNMYTHMCAYICILLHLCLSLPSCYSFFVHFSVAPFFPLVLIKYLQIPLYPLLYFCFISSIILLVTTTELKNLRIFLYGYKDYIRQAKNNKLRINLQQQKSLNIQGK